MLDLWFPNPHRMEDDVDGPTATTMLFQILGGLGLFFMGVGVLWFVSVYEDKAA
jgi:hypothetical protein